jgi:hypothetical protein
MTQVQEAATALWKGRLQESLEKDFSCDREHEQEVAYVVLAWAYFRCSLA